MESHLEFGRSILLLGSTGNLGSAINKRFQESGYTLHCPTKQDLGDDIFASLLEQFELHKPRLVINCTSVNGVNQCHSMPLLSIKINSLLPKFLCYNAEKFNYSLIHFSTECVFQDSDQIISSFTVPQNPSTTYGATKLAGEFLPNKRMQLIRLPLLLSKEVNEQIVWKIVNRLKADLLTKASTDVLSTPIFVQDVAQKVVDMISLRMFFDRPIHLSSNVRMSMYETVFSFARQYGIGTACLSKALDREFKSPQQKPLRLGLKASSDFHTLPPLE